MTRNKRIAALIATIIACVAIGISGCGNTTIYVRPTHGCTPRQHWHYRYHGIHRQRCVPTGHEYWQWLPYPVIKIQPTPTVTYA